MNLCTVGVVQNLSRLTHTLWRTLRRDCSDLVMQVPSLTTPVQKDFFFPSLVLKPLGARLDAEERASGTSAGRRGLARRRASARRRAAAAMDDSMVSRGGGEVSFGLNGSVVTCGERELLVTILCFMHLLVDNVNP